MVFVELAFYPGAINWYVQEIGLVDRYYHFGFEISKQQEVVQKDRKKRKYW